MKIKRDPRLVTLPTEEQRNERLLAALEVVDNEDWRERHAMPLVVRFARLLVPFSSNDLWAAGLPLPNGTPRALGPVITLAKGRLGIIQPVLDREGNQKRVPSMLGHPPSTVGVWIGVRQRD